MIKKKPFFDVRRFDEWLQWKPDVSQEERELIIENLIEYLKTKGGKYASI